MTEQYPIWQVSARPKRLMGPNPNPNPNPNPRLVAKLLGAA